MSVALSLASQARRLAGSVPRLESSVLDLPTFDGNPNTTHVSVVTFPEGFGGYRYWMAHTPFPDESREDPHVCASNDNINWETPPGAPMPIYTRAEAIADFGAGKFNSDPELVKLHDGRLACYWRVSGETIVRKVTSDGRTWGDLEIIIDNPDEVSTNRLISPCIVPEDDGTYSMWTIYGDDTTARDIEHRTSADGVTWGAPTTCTLPVGTDINPWHIAVRRVDSSYHMLLTGGINRGAATNLGKDLYYWTSTDRTTWEGSDTRILPPSEGFERYYRSHFEPMPGQPLRWNLYLANVDEAPTDTWRISVHEGVDLSFGHHVPVRELLDDLEASKDVMYVPAEAMLPNGSTLTRVGNYTPVLSFPDGTYNWGLSTIRPPEDWTKFEARILWANAGAGVGDVEWRVQAQFYRDGDTISGEGVGDGESIITTAAGADQLVRTAWSAAINANDAGAGGRPNLFTLGVQRRGGDAEDTLPNAAYLIGVELRKAS